MSVIDYTRNLKLFDSYDRRFLEMMINEYKLKDNTLFDYLNDIDLDDVDIYWYEDSDPQVLGGFHMISQNVIYLNIQNKTENEKTKYITKGNNVIMSFPTIMHELCHYWQFQKNRLTYLFLQLPIVRDYTIEKQAYKISDYLDDHNDLLCKSVKDIANLKKEYGFPQNQFDELQKKELNS